jgi:hypothetical protein
MTTTSQRNPPPRDNGGCRCKAVGVCCCNDKISYRVIGKDDHVTYVEFRQSQGKDFCALSVPYIYRIQGPTSVTGLARMLGLSTDNPLNSAFLFSAFVRCNRKRKHKRNPLVVILPL